MMNNLNIAQDIWKGQYATDFALLDTPQEQIEFFKDLLAGNKKELTKLGEVNMVSTENQTKLSNLEGLRDLFLSKLKIARKRLEALPTYQTYDVQKTQQLSSEENIRPNIIESQYDNLDILLRDIAEKEPNLSGGEVWLLLKKELVRNTRKYDKDKILLQISSDDSEAIIWNSGRGKSNDTRLTKGYLTRNKWPVAKKWAKENRN
jgi:hypothetical protein